MLAYSGAFALALTAVSPMLLHTVRCN